MKVIMCDYCGSTEFRDGPSGGMSINVLCANEACRHWFNHTPALGLLEDLHKVEPTESEMEKLVQQDCVQRQVALLPYYREGMAMFRAGNPALYTQYDTRERRYNIVTQADMARLCGWLDAREGRL